MANINMCSLQIGQQYTAVQLAHIWGYQSYHPLVRGIVTPRGTNIILLFVTKEKQAGATPYEDDIKGNVLYMMGQEKHGSDKRLLKNLNARHDDIYLFFRELHHTPFTYLGRCFLINAEINDREPSKFEFLIENMDDYMYSESNIIDYIINFSTDNAGLNSLFVEGAKHIAQHVIYERNPHNRKEAIRIHGHKCKICGFDFNEVYGEELADGYIEVHHIRQLAQGEQVVNPAKDLLPVCANCHRMLHRKKTSNISVDNLCLNEKVIRYKELLSRL